MKKLPIILMAGILTVGLFSCKKICVRCENGAAGDILNECFLDDGQREDFVKTREFLGYTCIEI